MFHVTKRCSSSYCLHLSSIHIQPTVQKYDTLGVKPLGAHIKGTIIKERARGVILSCMGSVYTRFARYSEGGFARGCQ